LIGHSHGFAEKPVFKPMFGWRIRAADRCVVCASPSSALRQIAATRKNARLRSRRWRVHANPHFQQIRVPDALRRVPS
jgi:hypothetical protein